MTGVAPVPKWAPRVGWPTGRSTRSANVLAGVRSDTGPLRWELSVPFPTNFASSPKRTCDHHSERRSARLCHRGYGQMRFPSDERRPATVRQCVDAALDADEPAVD